MISETILLINAGEREAELIKSLTASFDVEVLMRDKDVPAHAPGLLDEKAICLVILQADGNQAENCERLRQVRRWLKKPVPVLVMLPETSAGQSAAYIRAGADDFCLLPLNEGRFAIRFLVLLECGQAMVHAAVPENSIVSPDAREDGALWHRIVGFLLEGVSYFTPGSQIHQKAPPIFNRWERVQKLGAGGDGEVWKVREIDTGRLAVAKIPHHRQMNVGALRAAAILKRLVHHPNVVHLLAVVKEGDRFVLILEYVPGKTLSQCLASGLSPRQKEDIFIQLLSVAAYAHHHRIMHRDIKPDNVMVTPTGNVKLLDFGIADDLAWPDGGSSSRGTLDFMPPEQYAGKSVPATDVWALGIILYLLVLERFPFYHDNHHYPMDISMDMTVVPPRRLLPHISVALDRMIMTCLEKSLEKRYPTAMVLLETLTRTFPDFGAGHVIPGSSPSVHGA